MEMYEAPSSRDQDLLESVVKAWFMVGKLGGFNGGNMQVSGQSARRGYQGCSVWRCGQGMGKAGRSGGFSSGGNVGGG